MSGRVFPLQGSEHTAVDALLPFYVNGTLQGEELARPTDCAMYSPPARQSLLCRKRRALLMPMA